MAGSATKISPQAVAFVTGPGAGATITTLTVTDADVTIYNKGASLVEIEAYQTGIAGAQDNLEVMVNGVSYGRISMNGAVDMPSKWTCLIAFSKNVSFPDDSVVLVRAVAAAGLTTYGVRIRVSPARFIYHH